VSAARGRAGASLLLHAALVVLAALTVAPLLWMVSASLMPAGEANVHPPRLLPSAPTLAHYRALLGGLDLGRPFMNSVIVSVGATALSLIVNGLAGYAFAKLRFPGRDRLFRALVIGLVIPVQVAMLPMFLELKALGLVNTYWAVLIPGMSSIFGIFLIRQYALSIPDELLDAARIDGASEGRIFWTIVLPLLKPILATFALFNFMSQWNDFLWPLIVLNDDRYYTLPVALASLVGEHVQDTELMMAGAVITVLPVLLLFLALQRAYVRGITAGSVKG
jgi:multiple sugar transport system permease protein